MADEVIKSQQAFTYIFVVRAIYLRRLDAIEIHGVDKACGSASIVICDTNLEHILFEFEAPRMLGRDSLKRQPVSVLQGLERVFFLFVNPIQEAGWTDLILAISIVRHARNGKPNFTAPA